MPKPGIKALANLVVDTVVQSVKSFSDGFQPKDLTDFVAIGLQAATSAGAFKTIGTEFKDKFSEADITDLKDTIKNRFVQAQLGVANEAEIDALVVATTDGVIAVAKIYFAAKALRDKKKGLTPAEEKGI